MLIHKSLRLSAKHLILSAGLVFVCLLLFSGNARAETPGCYVAQGSGYAETNCPTEGAARAVSQFSACFVVVDGSPIERDCQNLNLAGTNVPEPQTFTDDDFSDQPSEVQATDCGEEDLNRENCGIIDLLVRGINFLSAVAMLSIIGSMVIAGYMYMTARDNSGQIEQAKKRIYWTFAALGVLLFTYAFLQWLVPGGVFPTQ